MGNQKAGWKVRSWRRSSQSYTCSPPATSPAPPRQFCEFSPHPLDGVKVTMLGTPFPCQSPSRSNLRSPASLQQPGRDHFQAAPALPTIQKRGSTAFVPPRLTPPRTSTSSWASRAQSCEPFIGRCGPPQVALAPITLSPGAAEAVMANEMSTFGGDSHFFRSRKSAQVRIPGLMNDLYGGSTTFRSGTQKASRVTFERPYPLVPPPPSAVFRSRGW